MSSYGTSKLPLPEIEWIKLQHGAFMWNMLLWGHKITGKNLNDRDVFQLLLSQKVACVTSISSLTFQKWPGDDTS